MTTAHATTPRTNKTVALILRISCITNATVKLSIANNNIAKHNKATPRRSHTFMLVHNAMPATAVRMATPQTQSGGWIGNNVITHRLTFQRCLQRTVTHIHHMVIRLTLALHLCRSANSLLCSRTAYASSTIQFVSNGLIHESAICEVHLIFYNHHFAYDEVFQRDWFLLCLKV